MYVSARVSTSSNQHFLIQVYGSLVKGGCRSYRACIVGEQKLFRFLNNSSNVNERELLTQRLLKLNIGGVRSIHGTATVSMSTKDFYEVLGTRRDATSSELKKAYYAIAKKLHPDTNKDDPEAEKKFQEVQRAYEVLKDDDKRAQYDQFGSQMFEQDDGGGFNPFHDIFGNEDMFYRDIGGEDVKVSVELSFMEAVFGCTKNITFQADSSCGTCGGTGVPPGTKPATCKRCKGAGMESDPNSKPLNETFYFAQIRKKKNLILVLLLKVQITSQNGFFMMQSTCPNCKGTGKIVTNFCKTCKGKRVMKGPKTVKLNLVPGIDNNETLKVRGSGGADPEGSQPGDLLVTVKVREDPVFRRERSDIHVDAVLSIAQAMLGGTIQVPTLSGNVVVKVRPGTQPGQKVVLKKKGIKTKKSYTFGDQYVHFTVSIPSNLTKRQRQIIEEFADKEQADYDKGAAAAVASG
ncbi:chaperone [Lithospermum erythrorhizon]|uniref:Chaperone n=1 Tax=Lithospermum erythrorhizon TaxID=34254 RepID=A0AAV3NIS0_LITER